LWGVASSALGSGRSTQSTEQDETATLIRPPEIYPLLVWLAVAATVGYLVVMPLIGFFLATIVYSFVLMYLGHYRRRAHFSVISVAIALAFTFLFMRVVYVALPVARRRSTACRTH